uniref:Putative site-specific DNA endonuclease n=1 Tax=Nephroselmis olivacea TaxID=31312 RepID=Q9TCC8_NEPOL|nr:putative site-specific DNA endonuclease [Nephroselmis olivacea]AAF03169.1 putative site-specific DNA endonuclease [Nephroselmis olivacea]
MNLNAQWIVGFVDGEGCFHIEMNPQPSMKMKCQILCSFVITQHIRDIQLLHAIKDYFGCGVVRRDKENIYCYRVRSFQHLRTIIIPFFEKHELKTKKHVDFLKFRKVILMMEKKLHLEKEGFERIQQIVLAGRKSNSKEFHENSGLDNKVDVSEERK